MANFTVNRSIAAPPEVVFETLTDHRAYADFTPLRKAVLEKEGTPVPDGVGAVRSLSLAGPPMREEVLDYDSPRLFRYKLLSGLPTRDHVGTVTLEPAGDGTRVAYEIQTSPTLGPLSPLFTAAMKRSIATLLGGVAKEAVRRSRSAA